MPWVRRGLAGRRPGKKAREHELAWRLARAGTNQDSLEAPVVAEGVGDVGVCLLPFAAVVKSSVVVFAQPLGAWSDAVGAEHVCQARMSVLELCQRRAEVVGAGRRRADGGLSNVWGRWHCVRVCVLGPSKTGL